MSTKQLNFKALPVIAAADGATSPALTASDKGALAFSTTISKALMWDGTKWSSSGLKGDTGATGSVSAADQTKLNGIQAGATANATDAQLRDRSTHTGAQAIATVTGLQSMLDGKSSTTHTHAAATTTVAGFMSDADKVKLDGVAAGANNFTYAHPANHPASVIVQDASNRFVTDTEKAAWNGAGADATSKASAAQAAAIAASTPSAHAGATGAAHGVATTTVAGFISAADKSKLDGIAVGANNFTYAHPANHPASIIAQDASNRFVTDAEKASWNAKQNAGSYALDSHAHTAFSTNLTIDNQLRLGNGGGRVYSNSAFGANALMLNTTGSANTAIGLNSMYTNTTGSSNTALGQLSLYSNTSGTQNVAIGVSSMYTNSTGAYNTAVGLNALNKNDLGSQNTAVGCAALQANVGGTSNANTAVGYMTLARNNMGSSNTALGASALQSNTIGMSNTALGNGALFANTSGESNTAIGINALKANTSGFGNIAVGGNSSSGAYAPVFNPTTESNRVVMGSTSVTNAYIQVAWTVVSDARDKTNFKAIPHGLDFVKQLKPTAYQFRTSRESEETNGGVRYGFKAQDIAAIEPEAVIVDTTNPEKLYYNESNLIPILVKAIQELSAEVERLKNANSNT
jgi:hypothetical protein